MAGTDFPSSGPEVPWSPYSLFRHVLQLQVVHLQLSPQRQTPPRRGDGAITHVRTEAEQGPLGTLQTSQWQDSRLPGWCWTGDTDMAPSIPKVARTIQRSPVTVHAGKLGWLPQRPPEPS